MDRFVKAGALRPTSMIEYGRGRLKNQSIGLVKSLQNHQGFTLIEVLMVVAIIGLLAAIAIPNFLRYQATSRQAEAKTNLGGVFVAEVSFFGENSRYGSFDEVGYKLAGATNRYTYRSPATGGAAGSTNADYIDRLPASIGGNTPENSVVASGAVAAGAGIAAAFTATATGNIDGDPTADEWHVNDRKRDLQTADRNDVIT